MELFEQIINLTWKFILIGTAICGVLYKQWKLRQDTDTNMASIGTIKIDVDDRISKVETETKVTTKDLQNVKTQATTREALIRSDTINSMEKIKEAQNSQVALMHEMHRVTMEKIQDIAVMAASKK